MNQRKGGLRLAGNARETKHVPVHRPACAGRGLSCARGLAAQPRIRAGLLPCDPCVLSGISDLFRTFAFLDRLCPCPASAVEGPRLFDRHGPADAAVSLPAGRQIPHRRERRCLTADLVRLLRTDGSDPGTFFDGLHSDRTGRKARRLG